MLCTIAWHSNAQDSGSFAEDEESVWALEEVIVTAQKRLETAQDVPISMALKTGEQLDKANIKNLKELTIHTPNLYDTEHPVGALLFIRGIGSQPNESNEQSLGIYVDGIYRGRMQNARAPFFDLERIEILRGPQSILFGKNTIGGAISLTSKRPSYDFTGSVAATYEPEYNQREIIATLSGPITDSLGLRIAHRGYDDDGYLENFVTGSVDPSRDESTTRLVLDWQAGVLTVSSEPTVREPRPRPAGVTCGLQALLGGRPPRANTPWNRVRFTRGRGRTARARAAIRPRKSSGLNITWVVPSLYGVFS